MNIHVPTASPVLPSCEGGVTIAHSMHGNIDHDVILDASCTEATTLTSDEPTAEGEPDHHQENKDGKPDDDSLDDLKPSCKCEMAKMEDPSKSGMGATKATSACKCAPMPPNTDCSEKNDKEDNFNALQVDKSALKILQEAQSSTYQMCVLHSTGLDCSCASQNGTASRHAKGHPQKMNVCACKPDHLNELDKAGMKILLEEQSSSYRMDVLHSIGLDCSCHSRNDGTTSRDAKVHPQKDKRVHIDEEMNTCACMPMPMPTANTTAGSAGPGAFAGAPGRDLEAQFPVDFSMLALDNKRSCQMTASIDDICETTLNSNGHEEDDDNMSCLSACIVERTLVNIGVFDDIIVMDKTQDNEQRKIIALRREIQRFRRRFVVKGSLVCLIIVAIVLILAFCTGSSGKIEEDDHDGPF